MKILYITPHLSTGGLPQYLYKKIEKIINQHEIHVIEWEDLAPKYRVQKDKIKNLLHKSNFISWKQNTNVLVKEKQILECIDKNDFDIIHFEEFPEMFLYKDIINKIYKNGARSYKIIETSHALEFRLKDKLVYPDMFIFVSQSQLTKYKCFDIPSYLVEYPIEKHITLDRDKALKKLNLDPDYKHVLNVGLFTPGKNQEYVSRLARLLEIEKIKFHFIGNQAINFKHYWKPFMDNKTSNCIVYGERNDVEDWYAACDLFLFPSLYELNPLVIREALSYSLPLLITNLNVYMGKYDNLANYLSNDLFIDSILINKLLGIPYEHIDSDIVRTTKLKETNIKDQSKDFINDLNNVYIYNQLTTTNNAKIQKKIEINDSFIQIIPNDQVYIEFDSSSLGDTIAWIPYVEEFRKKHKCIVICSTYWNDLFIKSYPEVGFIKPGLKLKNIHITYRIGCFKTSNHLIDWRIVPLQRIASDILGLEYKEIRPNIDCPDDIQQSKDKIVCIATHTTAQLKYWNNPYGWQQVVDHLKTMDCQVWHISKESGIYMGNESPPHVLDKTGNINIKERITQLKQSVLFIGVSSGLSWLAWALGIPTIMISGATSQFNEPSTMIKIQNQKVCNSCLNNINYTFDKGNWNWCPQNKNFICSKSITSKQVIEQIYLILRHVLVKTN